MFPTGGVPISGVPRQDMKTVGRVYLNLSTEGECLTAGAMIKKLRRPEASRTNKGPDLNSIPVSRCKIPSQILPSITNRHELCVIPLLGLLLHH